MSRIYPVEVHRHIGEGDSPPTNRITVGIHTHMGYWLPTPAGHPHLEFPAIDATLAGAVAAAINEAYQRGREDVKREFRELLDVKSDDDRESWS